MCRALYIMIEKSVVTMRQWFRESKVTSANNTRYYDRNNILGFHSRACDVLEQDLVELDRFLLRGNFLFMIHRSGVILRVRKHGIITDTILSIPYQTISSIKIFMNCTVRLSYLQYDTFLKKLIKVGIIWGSRLFFWMYSDVNVVLIFIIKNSNIPGASLRQLSPKHK